MNWATGTRINGLRRCFLLWTAASLSFENEWERRGAGTALHCRFPPQSGHRRGRPHRSRCFLLAAAELLYGMIQNLEVQMAPLRALVSVLP